MADSHDVVIFGAGCIGRGLIAELVASAGLRPVLVEADDAQSVQLRDMVLESGAERVLQSVCGFDRDEACFGECVRFYASP